MRILHIVKHFDFGGAENHVRDIANVMDSMGYTVFIIGKNGLQNNMLNSGVKFISLLMKDLLILFNIIFLIYVIRKYKIDIIHAHQRLPVLIGSIAGKISGTPVIVTVHGQTKYDLRSGWSKKIPEKFIFVRQSSFDESLRDENLANKSVFIQNGVTVLNSDQERDYNAFCYISRIDKKHYSVISMIIKAVIKPLLNEYPDITFNIIGDGEYLDQIRKEAEEFNKGHKRKSIIIHGYVPDVKRIIQRTGLVMGVGRVAIETLACGVPLLSVNKKFSGGLVSSENYHYFKMNNFVSIKSQAPTDKNLINAIRDYFENIDYWQKESGILQNNIKQDFNIIDKTVTIISQYYEAIKIKNLLRSYSKKKVMEMELVSQDHCY